ncbi:MAG: hypothetical protein Ta2A_22090 [Treponemataceae bacterium]|nr:MAG: hypothetical protein Ta2A_22090 [Treponemataceae bacterium]
MCVFENIVANIAGSAVKHSKKHVVSHNVLRSVLSALLCVSPIFMSCTDLFFPPLEVVRVTHSIENDAFGKENLCVKVIFSNAIDKNALEKAFGVSADGSKLGGTLAINGETVDFTAFADFDSCAKYELRITAEAEDTRGLSMQGDYVQILRQRTDWVAPAIAEINFFYDSARTPPQKEYLYILFSKPVTKKSLQKAFSVSPSADFLFEFTAAGDMQEVIAYPASPLQKGKRYEITISTELSDMSGNTLNNDFRWTFVYGEDLSQGSYVPLTFQLFLADKNARPVRLLRQNWNNTNIASNSTLVLQFSRQINLDSLSSFISVTPKTTIMVTPDRENKNKAVIRFPDGLDWQKKYQLTIKEGIQDDYGNTINERVVYELFCSKLSSRPLAVKNAYLEMPDASGNSNFIQLDANKQYDFISFEPVVFVPGQAVMCNFYAFIELFEKPSILGQNPAAEDEDDEDADIIAKIPNGNSLALISAMQNLKITTSNGAADVVIKNVSIKYPEDTSVPDADKIPAKTGSKQLVLCASVEITRSNAASGFITFTLQKELCDLLGNSLKENWVIVQNVM